MEEDAEVKAIKKITLVVCGFVFLREIRPIEPFLVNYLSGPPYNYTWQEMNTLVYPIGTYSSSVLFVFMFLITDYLRYKPIIILDAIMGIFTYVLMFGASSRTILVLEQICYGFFDSSMVASNTYLYSAVKDISKYNLVTGHIRSCALLGRFSSGIISQVLTSYDQERPDDLVWVSVAAMVLATCWSFFIPSVERSIYFNRIPNNYEGTENDALLHQTNSPDLADPVERKDTREIFNAAWKLIRFNFVTSYGKSYVQKWSVCLALNLSAYFLVTTYCQVLWQSVANIEDNKLINGAIESISTLSGAIAAYVVGHVYVNWSEINSLFMIVSSVLLGALTFFCLASSNLIVIYLCYVAYCCLFNLFLTVAYAEIAKNIEPDSYALIFGFNSFVARVLTSILTFVFVGGEILTLDIRQQFIFYGTYHFSIGLCFIMIGRSLL